MLEVKYEAKLEFLGGTKQKPSQGGVWIFSGPTHSLLKGHFP